MSADYATVRSGAEERSFSGAGYMFLSSGYVLTTFLTTYFAEGNRPKFQKHMMSLVQAGTFLCFQDRRSSATRSSASDLTVVMTDFAALRCGIGASSVRYGRCYSSVEKAFIFLR